MASQRKGKVRISGLVRLMNHVRESLTTGIPEHQISEFQRMVTEALRLVELACRDNGAFPRDLPAPSRRAYEFLKAIDLEDLPTPVEGGDSRPKRIRISNLISSCRGFQQELAHVGRELASAGGPKAKTGADLRDLQARISALAEMIDRILARADARASALPDPSLCAYQWLKYLSDASTFREHVRTLARFYALRPEAHVELYNIAGLFRSRMRAGTRFVTVNEAFIGTPPVILRALEHITCIGKDHRQIRLIREYAHGEEYREASLDLALIGVQRAENVRGVHYDLGEVFARVNASYFGGQMDKPILTWNETITHAKFGHYVPATDTVMISIALDSEAVPPHVIEHVMHHELLHRVLGVEFVHGRRIAHSAQFQAAERRFRGYQRAEEFLSTLSMALR